jgi:serine/threonine protein kinase
MTPEQIERVFGRGRLKMVTGEHVEVFREAVAPGERRRYTKRFLNTRDGDFGQWTEREWRILARLIGHGIACVPDVVQFDRGRVGGMRIVQTYDAGITVDQWATLLPVIRDDRVHRHVFEDCAHWWALAHHCLRALSDIHRLELVHLDIKGDNVCIPYAPASFDPESPEPALHPVFSQFALIDFAFALVSKESLTTPLPIGWQKEYDYQSPRLLAALERGREGDLQPTRELDWRCDMYSLAAMLKRYLPDAGPLLGAARSAGWTPQRCDAAKALILRIRETHDTDPPLQRPHAELMALTEARLAEADLAHSLERGWSLAHELTVSAAASPLTPVTGIAPVTRIATPIHVTRSGRTAITAIALGNAPTERTVATVVAPNAPQAIPPATRAPLPFVRARRRRALAAVLGTLAIVAAAGALLLPADRTMLSERNLDVLLAPARTALTNVADAAARFVQPVRPPAQVASSDAPAPVAAPANEPKGFPTMPANAPASSAPPSSPRDAARDAGPAAPPSALNAPQAMAAARQAMSAPPNPGGKPAFSAALERGLIRTAPSPHATPKPPSRVSRTSSHGVVVALAPRSDGVSPASAERAHASWASLEPPPWIKSRAHSPGAPPGYSLQESEARGVAESITVAPATTEKAEEKPSRAQQPSVAMSEAARDPNAAPLASAPVAGRAAGAAGAVSHASAQSLFASRSVAPIEDRSVNPPQALASATAPIPSASPAPDELTAAAQRLLHDVVPRAAHEGELEISRVLLIAASAYRPAQDRALADAARLARIRDDTLLSTVPAPAPDEALALHDRARVAFVARRNVREALGLELRAFGADPRNPEVAGYLAMLYLRVSPRQPDLARQVALVALTARSPRYSTTRLEDWQTFAAASALTGRESDARNALFVTLALSASTERTCVAGWNAQADYGDRLRAPVEAMLYRVYMRGHSVDSPWCAWPPNWSAPPRLAGELVP